MRRTVRLFRIRILFVLNSPRNKLNYKHYCSTMNNISYSWACTTLQRVTLLQIEVPPVFFIQLHNWSKLQTEHVTRNKLYLSLTWAPLGKNFFMVLSAGSYLNSEVLQNCKRKKVNDHIHHLKGTACFLKKKKRHLCHKWLV